MLVENLEVNDLNFILINNNGSVKSYNFKMVFNDQHPVLLSIRVLQWWRLYSHWQPLTPHMQFFLEGPDMNILVRIKDLNNSMIIINAPCSISHVSSFTNQL